MVTIGGIPIETPLALGPMAGVTDMAFRTICREQGRLDLDSSNGDHSYLSMCRARRPRRAAGSQILTNGAPGHRPLQSFSIVSCPLTVDKSCFNH